MAKDTEKILNQLGGDQSFTEILNENKDSFFYKSIGQYILDEIQKQNTTKAKVIKQSGINKRFFFHIISDNKRPSRRYVIRIFLALKLDLKDIQWYLKACDYPQLYARDKRDAVIIYCINHKISVPECNTMLNKVGLENLGFENI